MNKMSRYCGIDPSLIEEVLEKAKEEKEVKGNGEASDKRKVEKAKKIETEAEEVKSND